ncbi:MAG: Gfo/Idh/MocA family oxidoreductase [Anaerolineales bacterium]|nr:Gfo/Idh/MocA family oxidoreductase [Anaerolineales bacterium]
MEEIFNWGIIGPGRIAEKFANDLQVVKGAALYAVASRSGSTSLAEKHHVPRVYRSYQEIAADPKVDAIYIATPHPFHASAAKLCLEAGKPVLVEKPLTVNAAETAALIRLSQEKQVFLMEAMWSRFLPIHQQIRQWLDEEKVGQVQAVTSSFGFLHQKTDDDRWLNPLLGGGSLLDIGIYPLSITQFVMQTDPVQIQAQALLSSTGVDIYTAVNLKYASGAVAQFSCTFLADTTDGMEILGTEGKITIKKNFHMAEKAVLEVYQQRKKKFSGRLRSSGFEYQIEEAIACIRAGRIESQTMSHADSLGNMRLMDQIRTQIGVKYPFE